MDQPPPPSKPSSARSPRRLPPLPSDPGFWRSPVRGVRFTAALGLVLLVGLTLLFVTGLLSYAAYNPDLASVNDKTPDRGWLGFYLFDWPTHPYWLYRLTQGFHVTVGVALIPVLLAKLWSVIPRFFALPPVKSLAHALERLSLVLLVGGALFEFVTGVLNVQLDYIFPGSFYRLHFYGAWVFFGGFVAHAVLKMPKALRVIRSGELRSGGARPGAGAGAGAGGGAGARAAVSFADDDLASPTPAAPTISRRGAFALVGTGSLFMLLTTAGRSIDGPLRRTALLAPHGWEDPGGGPNGFQINKTAASVGVRAADATGTWRLTVSGPAGDVHLSRAQLLAMTQHTSELPIACVEGWSTSNQSWRGVRLRDLAALAGYPDSPPGVFVESLQRAGAFRSGALRDNQVRDGRSLLALRVNGADLSLDHGFPARIIVPAAPGVLNTKWVAKLTFGAV
ncbi:molybdopterin-dependent oxidoreductase [Streptomyces sp. NPDC058665]|uniref:molybdopterin-dependent oxidoreductase n=1 Tax=Streptomyces sp. NPDC058665 TaxID=3346586 RepID=UPI003667209A